jgi:hypothetical protein
LAARSGVFCPKLLQGADVPKAAFCFNGSLHAVGGHCILNQSPAFLALSTPQEMLAMCGSRVANPFDHQ